MGGVVISAQNLMLAVPEGEQMEVGAWVANKILAFSMKARTPGTGKE